MFPLFTEPSASLRTQCVNGLCITVEEEVSAEAGLCLVIPCSVSGFPFGLPRKISWFKCGSPQECDDPVMLFSRRDGFNERQALIDYDPISQNCSIIMNDLTESDSGSYFSFFRGKQNSALQGMTIAVKGTESSSKICTADVVIPKKKHKQGQHICILMSYKNKTDRNTVSATLLWCQPGSTQ